MTPPANISRLPVEVMIKIIEHLGPADINALAGVNSACSYLVNKVVCLVTDKAKTRIAHKNIHRVYTLDTPPETLKQSSWVAILELHKTMKDVGYSLPLVFNREDLRPEQPIARESNNNIWMYSEEVQTFTNVMKSHVVACNLTRTTEDYTRDLASALAQSMGSQIQSLELVRTRNTNHRLELSSDKLNYSHIKPLSVLPRGVTSLKFGGMYPGTSIHKGLTPNSLTELMPPGSVWDRLETLEILPTKDFLLDGLEFSLKKLQRLVISRNRHRSRQYEPPMDTEIFKIINLEAPSLISLVIEAARHLHLINITAPALEHANLHINPCPFQSFDTPSQFLHEPGQTSCFLSVHKLETNGHELIKLAGSLPNVISLNVGRFHWPSAEDVILFGDSLPNLENLEINDINVEEFYDRQSNWIFQDCKKLKALELSFRPAEPNERLPQFYWPRQINIGEAFGRGDYGAKSELVWRTPLHMMHPELEELSVIINREYQRWDIEKTSLIFWGFNSNIEHLKSLTFRGFETVEIRGSSFPALESLEIDGGQIRFDIMDQMIPPRTDPLDERPYEPGHYRWNFSSFSAPLLRKLFIRRNRWDVELDLTSFPNLEELTVANNMRVLELPTLDKIKRIDLSFNPQVVISIPNRIDRDGLKLLHRRTPKSCLEPLLREKPTQSQPRKRRRL